MPEVIINNINQGGIADSDYVGAPNSVADMVNLDIHSEAGVIKCNQALVKDSGTTVTEFIQARVSCSNGSTYLFGNAGGVYEREAAGAWTKRATAAPAAGSAAILSAEEQDGYIYYAMQNRLGRFAVPAAGGAVTLVDNWATFGVGDALFHPMKKLNLVLYIGDGNRIAQVDAGVFSANALDIQAPLRVSSLWNIDTDLLIGTFVNINVMQTQVIRWNTWSPSFSVSDPIPEVGVNAFLDADNVILVNAGTKGNIYIYDGVTLEPYKKLKGNFTATNKAKVYPNAVFNFNGMPLFGLSQVTGEGVNLGVYSIHRTNRNYNYVLNLEYKISTGNLTKIKIGAIVPVSADQFLVAWQDDTSGSPAYGVDIMSLTVKATGYFTTRVMYTNRQLASEWGFAHAAYRSLPENTDIRFYEKKDGGDFSAEIESVNDDEHKITSTSAAIGQAMSLQIKTELVPNANNAPEVEVLIVELQGNQ